MSERPLFVLPTSEVADLYKEQKELKDAHIKSFGLVGRQTNICADAQKQPRPALQKFFEVKKNREAQYSHVKGVGDKMEMLISAQDQTRNSLGLAAPSSLAQAGEPSPTTPQCPEIKFTAATNDDINTVIAEDPFTV